MKGKSIELNEDTIVRAEDISAAQREVFEDKEDPNDNEATFSFLLKSGAEITCPVYGAEVIADKWAEVAAAMGVES